MTSGQESLTNDKGTKAVRFINNLTHTKGKWARTPFNLRPWQENRIIRPLFGTIDPATGLRQYRTCFVEVPRKNGKSEIAAGVALYCLMGDGEEGAEVYSAAADRDQAALVFNVAAQMVRNDPYLDGRLKIIDSQKRIVDHKTGSFYRAISADAHTKHGFNASAVIYDEIHAAPNRDLWDVLTTSMGAREQPITMAITTAGFDKQSICWELHDYGEKLLEGKLQDPTFLPVIYSAPMDADWTDEQVWRDANPALGDFRGIEEMRMMFKRAKEIPAQQNTFRRLYLNQWTESETRWLDGDTWKKNERKLPDLTGRRCFASLDLASIKDVACFGMLFPKTPEEGEGFWFIGYYFIPSDNIKARVDRDRVRYDLWRDQGHLITTPGNVIDYNKIREKIDECASKYHILEIAYDRWNAQQLVNDLAEDGANMVAFGQGFSSMAAPCREMEKLLISQQFNHDGNPVLEWMSANVVVDTDAAGNMKPDKKKSTEKIDGIVTALMCLGRALVADEGDSYTAEHGVMVL